MAEVSLVIGGRTYVVACRDGGEAHLQNLGMRVDAKVDEARSAVGTSNEVRQLLFAALLLADDADEGAAPAAVDPAIGNALSRLASRIEAVADALETDARSA